MELWPSLDILGPIGAILGILSFETVNTKTNVTKAIQLAIIQDFTALLETIIEQMAVIWNFVKSMKSNDNFLNEWIVIFQRALKARITANCI